LAQTLCINTKRTFSIIECPKTTLLITNNYTIVPFNISIVEKLEIDARTFLLSKGKT